MRVVVYAHELAMGDTQNNAIELAATPDPAVALAEVEARVHRAHDLRHVSPATTFGMPQFVDTRGRRLGQLVLACSVGAS